ncbi:hypothetical protein T05_5326 [Trichinella murrelli]|uniref:Uncharacterized protein n=1 Tax=Trichinella murrelli TaxID=144512 RepID=A0A0V0T8E4_9BILA|nr:hypothetical protein T05_5326 [Trichinella murrelli]
MHKYAVIAFPFIFSNLRCFREKNLHNNAILRSTSDAEDEELATPSAARRLLYSYVKRNVNVQDNTTQYLERLWPQALPSGYARGQIKICICP